MEDSKEEIEQIWISAKDLHQALTDLNNLIDSKYIFCPQSYRMALSDMFVELARLEEKSKNFLSL